MGILFWLLDRCKTPPDSLEQLLALNSEFHTTKVKDILGADPESLRFGAFVPLDPEHNSMLDLMLILGRYALHRVFICEVAGDVTAIVTQTRVVEMLLTNVRVLADIADRSLLELGMLRLAILSYLISYTITS